MILEVGTSLIQVIVLKKPSLVLFAARWLSDKCLFQKRFIRHHSNAIINLTSMTPSTSAIVSCSMTTVTVSTA